MRLTFLAFPLPLLLTGCPASVTAEGLDDGFGMPVSAVRFHVTSDGGDSDTILISNVPGLCEKYGSFAEASKAFTDAAEDVTSQNYCKNLEEPLNAYVPAVQALQFKGATYVSLSVNDFDEGEYAFGETGSGLVQAYTDLPLEGVLDDFDADGSLVNGCGTNFNTDSDPVDTWTLDDGSVKLDTVESKGAASGSADGTMKDENGKADGDFQATFTAAWCEVDLSE